ncbi:uncharacterized protein TNCV_3243601 [Trichonephila clavipes]|nr:uncharacterized protein TNCV_3243601 [Trichonephila clavipes]
MSRFRLLNADGRLRIWCQAHEVMGPACQVGTVQGHGGSIMTGMFFPGFVWNNWCLYKPPSMQFGTQSCWVITFIHLCCAVERTIMELSSKTTVPLKSPGWLLAG